jgi:hypothetical protein
VLDVEYTLHHRRVTISGSFVEFGAEIVHNGCGICESASEKCGETYKYS